MFFDGLGSVGDIDGFPFVAGLGEIGVESREDGRGRRAAIVAIGNAVGVGRLDARGNDALHDFPDHAIENENENARQEESRQHPGIGEVAAELLFDNG